MLRCKGKDSHWNDEPLESRLSHYVIFLPTYTVRVQLRLTNMDYNKWLLKHRASGGAQDSCTEPN